MPQKMLSVCTCRQCKRARRRGRILGARLLKHLGSKAHFQSGIVPFARYAKGKRIRRPQNQKDLDE
ncbi:hypothetical protein HOU03_gp284 [Caulobacter phage CcrSC]|uniref:Uncharacterized protein n=1 Tax=Caulobacter phage CcrSC TaxID=2283272 RepID=A0A385EDM2_9CAUD|nr:hypothetical protein HOU03_gp284 [Caulobacter phage CcrSC]AXQ69984.1 hypothetical protein CcrSC_gp402 [Caulobacter phage CcrSC]